MSSSVIDRTIGFPLGSIAETKTAFTEPLGKRLYSYARRENPTVTSCELALAEIEMAEKCLLTTSGMTAIDVAYSIFNDPNDHRPWIFPDDSYSGTIVYADKILKKQRGTNVIFANSKAKNSTTSSLIEAIEETPPALVFIEPVSNPMLDIIDVPKVIKVAHKYGARVIVDNTFATPYLFRPLEAGADIVVHSATKYLSGHNNILAGVIAVNDPDLYARLISHRNVIGSVISPDDAGRLEDQLQTFSLRVVKQNQTAMKIAAYLDKHSGVAKVRYPGLPTHCDHDLAQKLFGGRGFGAMITFDLAKKEKDCSRFVDDLSAHVPHIGSLGEVTTTFLHVEACFLEGYSPSTIRLSVGIEPADEIISKLDRVL
ncbi:MAG: PLP-dependent transferase [Kordiimonadaceae bacterium]|jgi:cystathionine beta-lyase/cystathionine gamma-synthase|nr:PLP-dependent transferase [Kordiimonadaceae bacterium]